MVSREEAERELPAGQTRAVGRPEERGASPARDRLMEAGFRKCPYLAGRPPCGTHHLFPSGANVCWADPREEKPYRPISRETQSAHCFGGAEGQDGCERYRAAVAGARPLPRFDPWPAQRPAGPPSEPDGRRWGAMRGPRQRWLAACAERVPWRRGR